MIDDTKQPLLTVNNQHTVYLVFVHDSLNL